MYTYKKNSIQIGKRIDTIEIIDENGTHYTSMVLFLYQFDRFKRDRCLSFFTQENYVNNKVYYRKIMSPLNYITT